MSVAIEGELDVCLVSGKLLKVRRANTSARHLPREEGGFVAFTDPKAQERSGIRKHRVSCLLGRQLAKSLDSDHHSHAEFSCLIQQFCDGARQEPG